MREATDIIEKTRALRIELGLSQPEFAKRFGLPVQTYVQWERGRRTPDTAALTLLHVIVIRPHSVEFALSKRRNVIDYSERAMEIQQAA